MIPFEEQVRDKIKGVEYLTDRHRHVICVITMENGWKEAGQAGCINPNEFDEEFGEKLAFEAALREIMKMEAYLRQQGLFEAGE